MTEMPPQEIKNPASSPVPSSEETNPGSLFPNRKAALRASFDFPLPTVGFFRRFMAFFMDLVLVEWITVIFTLIGLSAREAALGGGIGGILWQSMDEWAIFHSGSRILVFLGYFTFFSYYGGQTPGKMVFRFQVVMNNGAAVPVLKALIRTLGYFLGFLSFGLGFFAAAISPSGRALHDFLSGTRVEKKPSD